MNVARAVSAGPTLILYVVLVAVFALYPVPVPTVTVVLLAPAAPTENVRVPLFTVGRSLVKATVPVLAGNVRVVVPATALATTLVVPLVEPAKIAPFVEPAALRVTPPVNVTAVVVDAPRPVTVANVSLSAVKYVLLSNT
jgi:hypothetical protein